MKVRQLQHQGLRVGAQQAEVGDDEARAATGEAVALPVARAAQVAN